MRSLKVWLVKQVGNSSISCDMKYHKRFPIIETTLDHISNNQRLGSAFDAFTV